MFPKILSRLTFIRFASTVYIRLVRGIYTSELFEFVLFLTEIFSPPYPRSADEIKGVSSSWTCTAVRLACLLAASSSRREYFSLNSSNKGMHPAQIPTMHQFIHKVPEMERKAKAVLLFIPKFRNCRLEGLILLVYPND